MNATAPRVRPARWAGQFYPADPAELRAEVEQFLDAAQPLPGPPPKALIAPHAGYIYSGPVAGSAYAPLRPGREVIRRVVLIGPAHYEAFGGVAASSADVFATPLGEVALDHESLERLRGLPQVTVVDQAHQPEHSLEVQLPFLQTVLADFKLTPLLVWDATDDQISQVIDALWGGPETCVVISSDLSHYLTYKTARQVDETTARAIEALAADDLTSRQACGCRPIRGLLRSARRRGLRAQRVDLRNSGDTAGDPSRVVGYGAFVFRAGQPG